MPISCKLTLIITTLFFATLLNAQLTLAKDITASEMQSCEELKELTKKIYEEARKEISNKSVDNARIYNSALKVISQFKEDCTSIKAYSDELNKTLPPPTEILCGTITSTRISSKNPIISHGHIIDDPLVKGQDFQKKLEKLESIQIKNK